MLDRDVKADQHTAGAPREAHDNRVFNRLDAIAEAELKGVSERLVRIESRMNGG